VGLTARIEDLGDLHPFGALEEIDAAGLVVAPLYDPAIKAGDTIALPDFASKPAAQTVAPGQPAALLILRQDGTTNRYVVERVVQYEPVPD
jgi:hypothetical protein